MNWWCGGILLGLNSFLSFLPNMADVRWMWLVLLLLLLAGQGLAVPPIIEHESIVRLVDRYFEAFQSSDSDLLSRLFDSHSMRATLIAGDEVLDCTSPAEVDRLWSRFFDGASHVHLQRDGDVYVDGRTGFAAVSVYRRSSSSACVFRCDHELTFTTEGGKASLCALC